MCVFALMHERQPEMTVPEQILFEARLLQRNTPIMNVSKKPLVLERIHQAKLAHESIDQEMALKDTLERLEYQPLQACVERFGNQLLPPDGPVPFHQAWVPTAHTAQRDQGKCEYGKVQVCGPVGLLLAERKHRTVSRVKTERKAQTKYLLLQNHR